MTASATPDLHYIDYAEYLAMVEQLSRKIGGGDWKPAFIVGIGRGGLVPGVYLSHALQIPMLSIDHSSQVQDFGHDLLLKVAANIAAGTAALFVDDINDSGGTLNHFRKVLAEHGAATPNARFAVLIDNASSLARVDYAVDTIDRRTDKRWFVFPWEAVMNAQTLVEEAAAVPERLG
jgi:uncharacterized protein